MFSLKNPLITRVLQKTFRRPLSLMDRFCKKDNNGGENNKSVTIQLNNVGFPKYLYIRICYKNYFVDLRPLNCITWKTNPVPQFV